MITTWRKLITESLQENDNIEHLIFTIDDGELDRPFNCSFGSEQGADFTAWSNDWVYFPLCYDGSEWVGYAPRNPCNTKMKHQGG